MQLSILKFTANHPQLVLCLGGEVKQLLTQGSVNTQNVLDSWQFLC